MAFLSPSPMELVVILVIALLVLGPSRLPETARSLGRGLRELRGALQNLGEDDDEDDPERERPRAQRTALAPPAAGQRRDDPGGLPVDPAVVMNQPYDDDLPELDPELADDGFAAGDDGDVDGTRAAEGERGGDDDYQNDAESSTPSASS